MFNINHVLVVPNGVILLTQVLLYIDETPLGCDKRVACGWSYGLGAKGQNH